MSLADKASLLLIPTGYKSQKVYSIFPTDGVGDFDFSRSSSATRIAKNGLITTVAANVPRLEYPLIDGVVSGCPSLLLEPQRTNLIQYSEDFSQSYWTKLSISITSNSVISPDGSLNASSFTQSGGTAEHSIYHSLPTITSGAKYTGSVFLKYDDWQYFQVRFRSGGFGGEIGVIYDAINKTITTTNGSLLSYKVEEYANDWVRISIVVQSTSASNYAGLVVAYNNSGNVFNDPDSVPNTGANVYIFGAQIEQGSYPTSYIPTNGSAVTRLAETCNNSGDASTFNDSEGVLMAEISFSEISRLSINDGSTSNRLIIGQDGDGDIRALVTSSTTPIFDVASGVVLNVLGETLKMALKYKQNDFALWVNGVEVATENSGATPSGLNVLEFTAQGLNTYGNTKQIQYYNSALTDSELEQLTSWTSFSDMATSQLYSIE